MIVWVVNKNKYTRVDANPMNSLLSMWNKQLIVKAPHLFLIITKETCMGERN
jgi:hypothetical protein